MQIHCPKCGQLLECPEPLPDSAQCPYCQQIFSPNPPPPVQPVDVVTAPQPTAPMSSSAYLYARSAVQAPAISLLIVAAISILWSCYVFGVRIVFFTQDNMGEMVVQMFGEGMAEAVKEMKKPVNLAIYLVVDAVYVLLNAVALIGSIQMLRLKSYGLAFTGALVAMVPLITCFCANVFVGVPIAIWVITVLNRPAVRDAFAQRKQAGRSDAF